MYCTSYISRPMLVAGPRTLKTRLFTHHHEVKNATCPWGRGTYRAPASPSPPSASSLKTEDDHIAAITSDLAAGHEKVMIAQVAPAVRVSLGEEFGLPVGTPVQGKAISALRALGFDYVFDVAAGADLTIMEEGAELLHRIADNLEHKPGAAPLPMFSSCCPGWVDFVEKSSPVGIDLVRLVRLVRLARSLCLTRGPRLLARSPFCSLARNSSPT